MCGYVEVTVLSSLSIVLCSLCLIAENLVRRLDFLELDYHLSLTSWVAIGMVLEREAAVCFPDLILGGVRRHLEVRIVVPRGVGFDHGCGG